MNNLGFLNKDLENCETAEQFYLKSLKIRQNLFSENHSDIAQSLNNLGLLYNDYGNLEKVESRKKTHDYTKTSEIFTFAKLTFELLA